MPEQEQERSIPAQGLVVGLIGAAAVAAWFFVIDLALDRPFYTPAALGSTLFLGIEDLERVEVSVAVVGGYTLVHLAAFAALGIVVVAVLRRARRTPPLILGALLLFVVFQALFLGLLAIAARFLLGGLAWWAIGIANLLAAVAMGWYLWTRDPDLREAVRQDPFDRTR